MTNLNCKKEQSRKKKEMKVANLSMDTILHALQQLGVSTDHALTKDGKISHANCASRFYEESAPLVRHQRNFYHWDRNRYQKTHVEEVKLLLRKWLNSKPDLEDKAKNKDREEILSHLSAKAHIDSKLVLPSFLDGRKESANDFLNLNNGVLNWRKFIAGENPTLLQSDSELFTLTCLPIDFKADAECPTFLKYLEKCQPEKEVRDLLQEWLGYNLIYSYEFQKFMLFVGSGANGKSVFCTILAAILGRENFTSVSMEAMDEKRLFQLTSMDGMLANIVEDMNEIQRNQVGLLNRLSSGGLISGEEKNKNPFTFNATARLTFATNILPHFSDRSNGIWRRLMIVPWDTIIPVEDQNKALTSQAYWHKSGELSGILLWGLEGLKRLYQNGKFTEPAKCKQKVQEHRVSCNSCVVFLNESCSETIDLSKKLSKSFLYLSYQNFCRNNGYKPVGQRVFNQDVKTCFPKASESENAVRLPDGRRDRCWYGFVLDDTCDTANLLPLSSF